MKSICCYLLNTYTENPESNVISLTAVNNETKEKFEIVINDYDFRFYLDPRDAGLAEAIIQKSLRIENEGKRSLMKEQLVSIKFDTKKEFNITKSRLKKQGLNLYQSGVTHRMQFLYSRKVKRWFNYTPSLGKNSHKSIDGIKDIDIDYNVMKFEPEIIAYDLESKVVKVFSRSIIPVPRFVGVQRDYITSFQIAILPAVFRFP